MKFSVKFTHFVLIFFAIPLLTFAQNDDYNFKSENNQHYFITYDQPLYQQLTREIIKDEFAYKKYHLSVKPFIVNQQYTELGINNFFQTPEIEQDYYNTNENLWSNLKRSLPNISYKNDAVSLTLAPIIDIGGGQDIENNNNLFTNTRGAKIFGNIDGKVGFYTRLTDNQIFVNNYTEAKILADSAFPGEGRFLGFKNKERAYDFFNVAGYISVPISKHITTQFGRDKNFIGNGYRSLILSDNSPEYLFLKINTQIGRIQYVNLFTEMYNGSNQTGISKKYVSLHYLGLNIHKDFSLGFFDAVIQDGTGGIELNYLNPVIFYRAVEHQLGSPHNALIGMDFSARIKKTAQLYGQLVLDEFNITELRNGNGWWANKFAYQIGARYFNAFGIENFNLQAEYNTAKPYTYSHFNENNTSTGVRVKTSQNYSNYNQSIAHPLGANFQEVLLFADYTIKEKINIAGKIMFAKQGLDNDTTNYGSNILLDYSSRESDYNNFTTQGLASTTTYMELAINYKLLKNTFLYLSGGIRQQSIDGFDETLNTQFFNVGLRVNASSRSFLF